MNADRDITIKKIVIISKLQIRKLATIDIIPVFSVHRILTFSWAFSKTVEVSRSIRSCNDILFSAWLLLYKKWTPFIIAILVNAVRAIIAKTFIPLVSRLRSSRWWGTILGVSSTGKAAWSVQSMMYYFFNNIADTTNSFKPIDSISYLKR